MSESVTPEDRSALAAELALGLLDGESLVRARELARAARQFADEVAHWSGRLAPMLDEIEPVAPPARVLSAIEERLGARQERDGNVIHLRRRVILWRGFAVGASAIAASLAMVLVLQPPVAEQAPVARQKAQPMVARLEAEDSAAKLVATWDPGDHSLIVAAAAGIAPVAGHSHELWVIPADGTPRSMGILPGADPMHVRVDAPMAEQLAEGATLALSVEPTGGSPTGLPTGPVIAAGKLQST
jgi:anti-sigma-K factor RskA